MFHYRVRTLGVSCAHIIIVNRLKKPVVPIRRSGVHNTQTARWAPNSARLITRQFNRPHLSFSFQDGFECKNKIENHPMQAALRVALGTLYQFLRVLQVLFHVLLSFNRSMTRSQISRSRPTYFTLHFTGLRLKVLLPILSTVVFHYFLLSSYYYYLSSCFYYHY